MVVQEKTWQPVHLTYSRELLQITTPCSEKEGESNSLWDVMGA